MGNERVILAHEPPLRIGAVELRPATREAVSGTRVVVVEPRVMQVLIALARVPGTILTRDDLTEQCWEGRVVGEDAINRVLSRLRALSREIGGFRIETITKVGYRLIADDAAGPPPAADERPVDRSATPIDRRLLIGRGVAATAIALAAGTGWLTGSPSSEPRRSEAAARGIDKLRPGMADSTAEGVALLEAAVAADPNDADAWGALAIAYVRQDMFATDSTAQLTRSRAAARRALELDPGQRDAIASAALILPLFGEWTATERSVRAALARAPAHAELLHHLAMIQAGTGRMRDATTTLTDSIAADPEWPYHQALNVHCLWSSGRLVEAERFGEAALNRWPRHFYVWFIRVYFLGYTGQTRTALAMIDDTLSRPPGIPESSFALASTGIKALETRAPGDIDAAMTLHAAAAPNGSGFAENAANFSAALGRTDMAFRMLDALFFDRGFVVAKTRFGSDQARTSTPPRQLTHFLFAPPLASIRGDPRFATLLRELGLDRFWREQRIVPDYRRPRG